jgi:type IV secretion system protein VirD4
MLHWKGRATDNGLYLGQFIDGKTVREDVRYPGTLHAITIGPNGSGKRTGLIVPNLADLKRSVFIIDPKGEAAAITAHARAKLGRVLMINPFNVLADTLPHLKSNGYNPLAALDPRGGNFTDDASGIGEALCKERSGRDSAFFSGSAPDLVAAVVMLERIMNGKGANLGNVRNMLTEPLAGGTTSAIGRLKTILDMTGSRCEPLRSRVARFVNGTTNMDVISTAVNETRFLDSPPIRRDLGGVSFDWDIMKQEIVTCYLILPADRLATHANFLRLVVTSALRALLRSPPSDKLPPVLFLLDEFARLGYLPPIETAMGIARGFGVQIWPILHDLNQLTALYKERWQTFIDNAGVLSAFAPRDLFTAKYLCDLCGQKIANVHSRSIDDTGPINRNDTPQGLPRIRSEDLMGLPPGQTLCVASGIRHPIFTLAEGYWNTPYGRGLDPNPYLQTARVE